MSRTFSLRSLGSSNSKREMDRADNDLYVTHPIAVVKLLSKIDFSKNIWECACGNGAISKYLLKNGYNVKSTDICDYGFGEPNVDFLKQTEIFDGDIITNPPYKLADAFVLKALELINEGNKCAFLLRVNFLEGIKRYETIFKNYPPKWVLVFSKRLDCYHSEILKNNNLFDDLNFDDKKLKKISSTITFAWFVWEKGNKELPKIDWI